MMYAPENQNSNKRESAAQMGAKAKAKTEKAVSHAKPTKKEAAAAAVKKMRQASLQIAPQPTPSELVMMPVSLIETRAQVRTEFNDETLNELASDIATRGVLQPVLLRRNPGMVNFVVIAGERRLRAAKLAGLEAIPAIVGEIDDDGAAAMQIAENIQREDLSLSDTAKAVRKLYELHGSSVTTVAEKIHKSKSWVSKHLAASCELLHWSAKRLLDDGVTEDLEIVLAMDKLAALNWQDAQHYGELLREGKAGRKTILQALANAKELDEKRKAEWATAKAAAATPEAKKAAADAEKRRKDESERIQREAKKNPTNILWQIECNGYKLNDIEAERIEILENHLRGIWNKGHEMTNKSEFRKTLRSMIIEEQYVVEIDTFTAGFLGDGLNVGKLLEELRKAD